MKWYLFIHVLTYNCPKQYHLNFAPAAHFKGSDGSNHTTCKRIERKYYANIAIKIPFFKQYLIVCAYRPKSKENFSHPNLLVNYRL